MSETKHSPEPWHIEGDCVCSENTIIVESPWTSPGDDLLRIVACVNACAGFSTEALEAGALGRLLDLLALWAGPAKAQPPLSRLADVLQGDDLQTASRDCLRALGRLP